MCVDREWVMPGLAAAVLAVFVFSALLAHALHALGRCVAGASELVRRSRPGGGP